MFYTQQAAPINRRPRSTNQGPTRAGPPGPPSVAQRHLLDPAGLPPVHPMGSAGASQARPGLRRSEPNTRSQLHTGRQQSHANTLPTLRRLSCGSAAESSPVSSRAAYEDNVPAHGATQVSREEGPLVSQEEQDQQWHERDIKINDMEREILNLEAQVVLLMSKQPLTADCASEARAPVKHGDRSFVELDMGPYLNAEVSPDDGLYHCLELGCAQKFEQRSSFRKHMRRHVKPVFCPKCQHTTADQRDMRRHVDANHKTLTEEFGAKCPKPRCLLCRKEFTLKHNLQKHLKKIHGVKS